MIGRNIAPGLNRSFACEGWELIDESIWKEEKKAAFEAIRYDKKLQIYGFDINKKAVSAARENAGEAGPALFFRGTDSSTLQVCRCRASSCAPPFAP